VTNRKEAHNRARVNISLFSRQKRKTDLCVVLQYSSKQSPISTRRALKGILVVILVPRQFHGRLLSYLLSLSFPTIPATLSSACSLTRLQSVSYTLRTAVSSSRFHRSFAISTRPTGTTLGTGSGAGGAGSMIFVRTSRCWRRSAACVMRLFVCSAMVR
jgi:hypothetical protein